MSAWAEWMDAHGDPGWRTKVTPENQMLSQYSFEAGVAAERERWQSEEYPVAVRKGGEDMLEHAVKLAEKMITEVENFPVGWQVGLREALTEFVSRLRAERAPDTDLNE